MELATITAAKGFAYSADPQGSPEWVNLRVGRVTASRLKDWLAVGKRDGKPLKARLDYERELAFEKQFNVPFTRFVTDAMSMGRMAEAFVREQYASVVGNAVTTCGAFYNERFVASPDGLVGDDGLVEFKWLYDTSFSDVLVSGIPDAYYMQVQGQLWATGRKWCDFVAGNGNTGYFKVIRVYPDLEMHKQIEDGLSAVDDLKYDINTDGLFQFNGKFNDTNLTEVDW